MDSEGNLYRISDSESQKKFIDSLRVVSTEQAKVMRLHEVRRQLTPYERKTAKIGRNAPCGCGSGIKFKKCCYGKEPPTAAGES